MGCLLWASGSWPYAGEKNHNVHHKNLNNGQIFCKVQTRMHGYGHNVAGGTVSVALTAVGQATSLDTWVNPLKTKGSDKFLHKIQVVLDWRKKEDSPTMKKLLIEFNILEFLVRLVMSNDVGERQKIMANLILIDFYYLLRVREYTCKQKRTDEKQTVQLRLKDVTFFNRDSSTGILQQGRVRSSTGLFFLAGPLMDTLST